QLAEFHAARFRAFPSRDSARAAIPMSHMHILENPTGVNAAPAQNRADSRVTNVYTVTLERPRYDDCQSGLPALEQLGRARGRFVLAGSDVELGIEQRQLPVCGRVGDHGPQPGRIIGLVQCDERGHGRDLGRLLVAWIGGAATRRGDPLEPEAGLARALAQRLEALVAGVPAAQQKGSMAAGLEDRDDLEARSVLLLGSSLRVEIDGLEHHPIAKVLR